MFNVMKTMDKLTNIYQKYSFLLMPSFKLNSAVLIAPLVQTCFSRVFYLTAIANYHPETIRLPFSVPSNDVTLLNSYIFRLFRLVLSFTSWLQSVIIIQYFHRVVGIYLYVETFNVDPSNVTCVIIMSPLLFLNTSVLFFTFKLRMNKECFSHLLFIS